MESIFFGYAAGHHGSVETIRYAAAAIERDCGTSVVLWENMLVDGRVVIAEIMREIDQASMCIFDLTEFSENVLFEIGYALSRAKPIWLTLNATFQNARPAWKEFALLNPIGYTPYRNSGDFAKTFMERDPLNRLTPAYDDLIEPILPATFRRDALFYCATFEPFEASSRLSSFLDSRRQNGLRMKVSDPSESTLDPITWFAPNVQQAAGVLIHFAGESRNRSSLHNRRHAFVAGMAHGFEIPLLMLAESDYPVPFDYQTLAKIYETSEECVRVAREWLDGLTFEGINWSAQTAKLRSNLSGLRFGEHVAENELADLDDYFVETSAFEEVVAARDTIFVGQRGTGKTANAYQAYESIAANKTNMAVLIKPPGFEFPALFSVISKLPEAQRDYFLDSLWRFIIQTEIAAVVLSRIEARKSVPLSDAEQSFVSYADNAPFSMRDEMSVRLEQTLNHLLESLDGGFVSDAASRSLVNEAFHSKALSELRSQLGPLLKDKKRVAVFVDNLDKGWEKGADFRQVARLILGLLTARGRLVRDFDRQDYWRDRIRLTVAMFLRSDIYDYLRSEAREPDKLPISLISWRDPETLLRVIEDRFVSSGGQSRNASHLWTQYFCPEVDGIPTRTYLTSVVLPRPRDIVYFCNKAVGCAIDRRHSHVEESDFRAAESTYSQYAYEALLVENGVTIPEMEDALLGFLGVNNILTRDEIFAAMSQAGLAAERHDALLEKLVSVSFLGLETKTDSFTYPEAGSQTRRAKTQASRLQKSNNLCRFQIHRAFHDFLDIQRIV